MNPQEWQPIAPFPTAVPDYVWCRRYDKPLFLPGRPEKKPKDCSKRIPHPDVESALQGAKRACRAHSGRWFGRDTAQADATVFNVYENGKVIERHSVVPIK